MNCVLNKNKVISTYLLFIVITSVVFIYNPTSVISLVYFTIIFQITNKLLFNFDKKRLYFSFAFYLGIMMLLFFLQHLSYPEMYGLNPIGKNADDLFFYHQASSYTPSDIVFSLKSVQALHPFSTLLKGVLLPLDALYNLLPIDFIFLNIVVLSFLPSLSEKVSYYLTKDTKISRLVFWLTMICPFIAMNSLILIRDGWTAVLLVAILLLIFERKYIRTLLLLALLFYIRVASGLEMIIVIGLFLLTIAQDRSNKFRNLKLISQIIILLSPILILVMYYYLQGYVSKQLGGGALLRISFLNTFMQNYSDSFYYRIMQLPILLRFPIGMIYFGFAPYFSEPFFRDGHFLPRSILNTLFVIENVFLVKYFVSGSIVAIKRNDRFIKTLVYTFLISMLVLSQISMQIRHKTMFMPLYYMIVGYGVYNGTKNSKIIGLFVSIAFVFINILFLLV